MFFISASVTCPASLNCCKTPHRIAVRSHGSAIYTRRAIEVLNVALDHSLILHSCGRYRHLIAGGLGEGGIRRGIEVDPDSGVPPVHPMAYMPLTDFVTCRKCRQPGCEAAYAEYSGSDWKGHLALDLV